MKRLVVVLLLAAACATRPSPTPAPKPSPLQPIIDQLRQAAADNPTNGAIVYTLARFLDQAGQRTDAIQELERLDVLGWTLGVAPHDFRNSASSPAFRKLTARQPLINRASTAFVIRERDLIPEGITYDPVDEAFYVSSIYRRKIVRVGKDGSVRDFVAEAQDGLLGGLGMKVDATRRLLWVASGAANEMRGHEELTGQSMLSAYDLRTGALVKKYDAGSKEKPALINDIAILADGTVLATDTYGGRVVRAGETTLEPFLDGFFYPNGIAAAGDQLFVADFRGLHRVNLADKSRATITANQPLGGIDGLSFHNAALIAIQNAIGNARVIRIPVDGGTVEVLESRHAHFDMPTTGVVVGNDYYFIANSQLRSFDAEGKIWPAERLKDVVVLRMALSLGS